MSDFEFDDFLGSEDFLILEEEDYASPDGESWDTGVAPDIYSTGQPQDIFSTK